MRLRRKWSPRACGSSSWDTSFNVFNVIGPGKKATRRCRCGHLDDAALGCGRAPKCAQEYQAKISGPLFDRIDMHVDVPAVSSSDLTLPAPREGSRQVASRVAAARKRQAARYDGKGIASNAEVDGQLLDEVATPESEGRKLLAEAADRFKLSARGYHRVLRVARTLADLEASEGVRRVHVAEALSYRRTAPARS